MANYPSKIFESAVEEMAKLPGIGRKSAVRMVLHLLKMPADSVAYLGETISKLHNEIAYCKECHNITDGSHCEICNNPKRNKEIICVVEDIRDVIAIENTGQYQGVYHVLGGIISPMDGVGPNNLNIESLLQRVQNRTVSEIILALPVTMEGETTNFFLYKKLMQFPLTISTIARGISFGDELEYADEVTLGRSILNRMPYQSEVPVRK